MGEFDKSPESAISLWHQMLQCYKSIERNIGGRMHDNYQQSLSRFDVLTKLHDHDEDWISVGDLTKRLLDTGGSISALLTRMEKEELLARRLNPADRRSFQIGLTGKGRALYQDISSDYSGWVAAALEDVSSEERDLLYNLLGRLKRAQTDR
ncbi:MarR family winged helix-turn-helix transcriptional regulator [Govanella unica]|uniref:MarR family transcriptional regulator n=1 Tax=Govanella unica TaxID=2975056 RepID=A0A9X3U0S3_9PROT|nr:MarR family transcriptional regulator [Govania unica]MDA5195023.1 MarR family transcriptional regulator [Govania unica]